MSVVGLAMLAALAHYATGSAREFRAGLLIVVAVAAVLVVAPVALEQGGPVARALALRPLVWLGAISYGVYLWHWPIFLALNGERTGLVRLAAVRAAVRGDGRGGGGVVVAARAAHPAMAAGDRPDAAAGGCDGRHRGGGDDARAAGRRQTGRRAGGSRRRLRRRWSHPRCRSRLRSPSGQLAPGTKRVAVFGDSVAWTMMRYLPPTPGLSFTDYTTIGCGIARGGPYRYAGETLNQKPECDAWPSRWAQRINHDRPDVVLLIIGRWEVVDRVNEGDWTHVGDDAYDGYLRGELQRALDILTSTGARVVVTTEPYNRRGEQPDGSAVPGGSARSRRTAGTRCCAASSGSA